MIPTTLPELEHLVFESDERRPQRSILYHEHISRYIFARSFCKSNIVLDVGCGSGYGVAELVRSGADLAVGMDRSREGVTYARKNYREKSAEFVVADLRFPPFRQETFDTITMFEVVEHLDQPIDALRSLNRSLKPDGLLILSTPNARAFSNYSSFYKNPFHRKEYSLPELHGLLSGLFAVTEFYGQVRQTHSYKMLRGTRKLVKKIIGIDLMKLYEVLAGGSLRPSTSVYPLKEDLKPPAKYFIAICRKLNRV